MLVIKIMVILHVNRKNQDLIIQEQKKIWKFISSDLFKMIDLV